MTSVTSGWTRSRLTHFLLSVEQSRVMRSCYGFSLCVFALSKLEGWPWRAGDCDVSRFFWKNDYRVTNPSEGVFLPHSLPHCYLSLIHHHTNRLDRSLDDFLRRSGNKIDLVVRSGHKKKECVWAEDQKGKKIVLSLINTKENKNKSQEHLFTNLMER